MNQAELESFLRTAFTNGSPPTGDQLVKILGDVEKRRKIMEAFSGRRWWEQDPRVVMAYDDAISFMEPEARRYYLPAYLIATLHADPEWFFSDMVVYHLYLPLERPAGDPVRERFERFLELLTPKEKSAIRTYLEYSSKEMRSEAAEEALCVLWHKY